MYAFLTFTNVLFVIKGYQKAGKYDSKGAGKKGKKGKSKQSKPFLINAVDSTGACPSGTKFQLIEVSTGTCIQSVETTSYSCSCSFALPVDSPPENYCIKIDAPGSSCSGDFGNSCIQYLSSTSQTEFCVQLTPNMNEASSTTTIKTTTNSTKKNIKQVTGVAWGSESSSTTSANTFMTNATYHQTQVILVTYPNQTCISDTVVNLCDCSTKETYATFTTSSTNCATSFSLPASETHYCINVNSTEYTCGGSLSSSCFSGPIEMPIQGIEVKKYEVIMQTFIGSIQLNLDIIGNTATKVSNTTVQYSLIDQNGVSVANKTSDCHGVYFSGVASGTYTILYDVMPGFTCGGTSVEGNRCQTSIIFVNSSKTAAVTTTVLSIGGSIQLILNFSQNDVVDLSNRTILYSLVAQNGNFVSTKSSGCQGVTFSNVTHGTYYIIYEAITGYSCGGSMIEGNKCQTDTFVCSFANNTTISYIVEKVSTKPIGSLTNVVSRKDRLRVTPYHVSVRR
jgi:hypothetical protein